MIFEKVQIETLGRLLADCRNAAIVCHMTPDGDALGSSLFLMHLLENLGKKAAVVVPDMPSQSLCFLPGYDSITIASYQTARAATLFRSADLIFCLDFNDLKRIDRTAPMVEESRAPRVVVDHHLNPLIEADVLISHPEVSSTCALLFQLCEALGIDSALTPDAAMCCCTGMMTDTGNFSYNSNDPQLYRILARLVATGIDKDAIYTRLFNTNSEQRVRIMGYGQSSKLQILREHQAALITLSYEELQRFGYHRGDTEALVNVPLSIPGITYSIFLREDEPDYVKVSMRSKGDFSVKQICEDHFGGGGHRNAAGGEMRCPFTVAIEKVLAVMPGYDGMLPPPDDDACPSK